MCQTNLALLAHNIELFTYYFKEEYFQAFTNIYLKLLKKNVTSNQELIKKFFLEKGVMHWIWNYIIVEFRYLRLDKCVAAGVVDLSMAGAWVASKIT